MSLDGKTNWIIGRRLSERISSLTILITLGTATFVGGGAGVLVHDLQTRSQQAFVRQLTIEEAHSVGEQLDSIRDRLQGAAQSSLIATALVDSAGKELYLEPYLQQLAVVRGIPVEVGFFDFEGKLIASGRSTRFGSEHQDWVKRSLQGGQEIAGILGQGRDAELVYIALVRYDRTAAPEGALLARVRLDSLTLDSGYVLSFRGGLEDAPEGHVPIPAEAVFAPLAFRLARTPSQPLPAPEGYSLALVIAVAMVASLLAGFTGRRLAGVITRDIDQLVDGVRRIHAGPIVGAPLRLPDSSTPEVETISIAVNELLQAVSRAHDDHMAAEQACAAKTLADEASQEKSLFMGRVSHEFRTPLHAIQGFADVLLREGGLTDEQSDGLAHITVASRHLLALVDNLLDISRLESGAIGLQSTTVPVPAVMALAASSLNALAHQHQVCIELGDIAPDLRLMADATRLQQVIQLLVSNAIKFNVAGGTVELEARAIGDRVELSVTDTGSGLDEQQIRQIFQPFNRAGREDGPIEGSGLGLTLCRRLVEGMHGTITIQSRPGFGTCVSVILPRARERGREQRSVDVA